MCNNMPESNDDFDQMLNEVYNKVKIGDIEFFPSQILYDCDPIAYSVYLNDWHDSECSDGRCSYPDKSYVCEHCCEVMTEEPLSYWGSL